MFLFMLSLHFLALLLLSCRGVLLLAVVEGSPASRAGLRGSRKGPNGTIDLGDIILSIDGVRRLVLRIRILDHPCARDGIGNARASWGFSVSE